MKLWQEAIIVGVVLVLVFFVLSKMTNFPRENKVVTIFLAGVLTHLLCEWVGVNAWYCSDGHACRHLKDNRA